MEKIKEGTIEFRKQMEKTTNEWIDTLEIFYEVIQSLNNVSLNLFNSEQQYKIRNKTVMIESTLAYINSVLKPGEKTNEKKRK